MFYIRGCSCVEGFQISNNCPKTVSADDETVHFVKSIFAKLGVVEGKTMSVEGECLSSLGRNVCGRN